MEIDERDEKKLKDREKSEKELGMEEEKQHSPQGAEIPQGGSVMESRLRGAVLQIVPDAPARERIIAGVKAGRHGRRKLTPRIPAAVLAACLLLSLLCFARPGVIGDDVVVYAATEEFGWQKLLEGERIQLKMEPFDTVGEDEYMESFDEMGRCNYYPYSCTFRLEVPEKYLYDKQFTTLRDDFITERGGKIVWRVAPERAEDAGRVFQGNLSLWIVDENRERQAALELELTKENGKCYAELKRVWESKAYKKDRHKK